MLTNKNISKLSSELHAIAKQQAHYGYTKALIVAKAYGFRTLAQAIDAVASRTSEKVVRNLSLNDLIIH